MYFKLHTLKLVFEIIVLVPIYKISLHLCIQKHTLHFVATTSCNCNALASLHPALQLENSRIHGRKKKYTLKSPSCRTVVISADLGSYSCTIKNLPTREVEACCGIVGFSEQIIFVYQQQSGSHVFPKHHPRITQITPINLQWPTTLQTFA